MYKLISYSQLTYEVSIITILIFIDEELRKGEVKVPKLLNDGARILSTEPKVCISIHAFNTTYKYIHKLEMLRKHKKMAA